MIFVIHTWTSVWISPSRHRGERIIRYSNIIWILEPNTNSIRIRIRVTILNQILFIFVFGWFSQPEYYSYSYSSNFPNRILFVFVFGWFSKTEYHWNAIHILPSIDTFDEWVPILDKWAQENLSPHFHFSDDWINQSYEKMSGWVFFFEYSALPKLLICS